MTPMSLFVLPSAPDRVYDVVVGFSGCEEIVIRNTKYLPRDENHRPLLSKVESDDNHYVGGTSFDIAVALQKTFGRTVKLIASIGKDPNGSGGTYVQTHIASLGIDLHPLLVKKGTSTGYILIERGLPPIIFSVKTNYLEKPLPEITQQTQLARPAIVIASGVMSEETEMVKAMFTARPEALGIPNPRAELTAVKRKFHLLLKHQPLLIMNHQELNCYLGTSLAEHEVRPANLTALHNHGAENIIITCNEHGAIFYNRRKNIWLHQPVIKFGRAADTTGAGDSFLAAVAAAILQGQSPEAMMRWGATMAGLKVCKEGGANVPSAEKFRQALK